jgi:gliding motility-associated-like protein
MLCTGFIVRAQLSADFNSTSVSGCAPLVVTFNDASTGNPTSWLWDLGNGTSSVLQNPAATYFDAGTYSVTLTIKNSQGEDSITKKKFITVYASPEINFNASLLNGCIPLVTNFSDHTAPVSGDIVSWQWDFGDGNLSGIANPHHTYSTAGSYNVSLRVTNSFGCVASKTLPAYISVNPSVKAGFSNSSPATCSVPATVEFANRSTGNGILNYKWNFGDGNISELPNPTHTYTTSGDFTTTLIVANAIGCTDTLIKPGFIIGNKKINFNAPSIVCEGISFDLKNTSTPVPTGTIWDFGDGTASNAMNFSKTFTKAGSYSIKMITDFGDCKDSITKIIQVIAKPSINFSEPTHVSCKAPFTVNFKNTSTDGATYFWDFGDGVTSNVENAIHTYLNPGNYTVKLIVTNASGCTDSLVKNNFVTINAPAVTINNLPQKGCAPLEHTFTASINSVDSVISYQWKFGDGNTSNEIAPKHVYTLPGNYTVTLIFTTAGGCTDSVKVVDGILVGSKPQSSFSANPLNTCANQSVSFTDHSTKNANEWLWFFGDGNNSSSQNPKHQYDDTGYFSITLIAINNGCADTVTLPQYVHVKAPIARFNYSKNCSVFGQVIFTDKSIGADTWFWDFGDGHTSGLQNPVHDYTTPGVYTVALTVTNQETGCSFTHTDNVKIIREIADFKISDAETCKNSPVTFSAVNSIQANIVSYTWRFGDGSSIESADPTINQTYTKAGSYHVTLIIKNVDGCYDSITKSLAVKVNGPTAAFRSTIPGICINNSVNFLDSSQTDGTHAIQQWKWFWGDGSSQNFSSGPFNHTYTSPGNYSASLKVTDSKGCTDSVIKMNTIIVSKPVASFSGDTLSCTSKAIHFFDSSTGPGITYSWNFGDGTTSNLQNPTHLYSSEGNYTVSLSINDIYGCNSFISKTNLVKIANPKANFLLSDSVSSCPPLVVNFTNTSTDYFTWSWDFGDGTSSSLKNPSHFYSSVGTFNVVLTVTGPGGCTSQKTKQIKIDGPTGSFSYKNILGCHPLPTNFKANTEKNVSFIWDFNDGTAIPTADSVVTHVYVTPGNYVPKLILVNESGCRVPLTGEDTIKVFGVLASFHHTGTLICDSGSVQFTSTSVHNDPIVNYLWNFGDGTTSTRQNPSHTYQQPGIFNTSLAVTTQNGCKDILQNPAPVKVNKRPKISITGNDGACIPAVLSFNGNIANPDTSTISWKWELANGNVSTQRNPLAQTYSAPGAYTVKAFAFSSNGCSDTATKIINIYPLPNLKVSANSFVCAGTQSPLQVSGAENYSWSPSTHLSCNNCATPFSRPDSSIKYFVKGTSSKGCVSTDSVTLTVLHPFKLSIGKPDTLCLGKSLQLNAAGTEKYTWYPSTGLNNASIASPVASPVTSTVYQVVGSDSKGCFKDTAYIPIKVYPVPVVSAGMDKTINVGQQTEIIPKISNDVTGVLWTPANGIISRNYPGITVKPIESIEYTVEVKNEGGCKARDKISVFVLCNNANIFVPNTFTPNGDGVNDIFYARGSGVFKIKNLKVFNRWGEIVFERSNFNANDVSAGWDGAYKGKNLQPDVFVYTLEVVCDNNTNLVFKGNIALIR